MTTVTMNRDQGLDKLTVKQIFDHHTYRIPIYQRAYAWSASEIHTLLRDIRDARLKNATLDTDRDYYLGSLVVNTLQHHDETIYEVIDGQQRLTTLFILLAIAPRILRQDHQNTWSKVLRDALRFEGRDRSQDDLKRLARDGADSIGLLQTDGIAHAAELIYAATEKATSGTASASEQNSEVVFSSADLDYLLQHVRIIRTQLPPNTDLNHYFEVMNTRGEQLEKHEILKARLLEKLPTQQDQITVSRVWDACSQLHRHIQVQFSPTSERPAIFGDDWSTFVPQNSASLFEKLHGADEPDGSPSENSELRLVDVLNDQSIGPEASVEPSDEEEGSYGSIIDFSNLLLHVLKIHQNEQFSWHDYDQRSAQEIRLDDKYLLEEFDKVLPDVGGEWVLDFVWLLLRVRYLLDTYVIRTQPSLAGNDEENWVIHRAGKHSRQLGARNTFSTDTNPDDEENQTSPGRRVLMLQAMFQVTDTRRSSKYFLFQILQWLHQNEENGQVSAAGLAHRLETSAQQRLKALGLGANLHQGTQVSNFIFNFLDYVLWLRSAVVDHPFAQTITDEYVIRAIKQHARHFSFRYRTSVEHFYPVAPDESQQHETLPLEEVNRFGNLCIMSRSDNSRRSNLIPRAKVAQYLSTNQSLKFQIMAERTNELEGTGRTWDVAEIEQHGAQMSNVLRRVLEVELPLPM